MSNYGGGYGGYGQSGRYDQPAGNYDQSARYDQSTGPYGHGQGNPNPYAQQQYGNTYSQPTNTQELPTNTYRQQVPQAGAYGYQREGYGSSNADTYGQSNNIEMGQVKGKKSSEQEILDAISDIRDELPEVDNKLNSLKALHDQSIRGTNREVDGQIRDESTLMMRLLTNLTGRVKKIEGMPGSGSSRTKDSVGTLKRQVNEKLKLFESTEMTYRKKLQEEMARQIQIVNPDATPEEIAHKVNDTSMSRDVFSQALLNSDRRGHATSTLTAVTDRHEAIRRLAQDMEVLVGLFAEMNRVVQEQQPVVERVDQQTTQVQEDVTKANDQLTSGVKLARATRRKKWWCFWICVLIVVIIAAVVGGYFGSQAAKH